jgi:hypothetical protein
MLEGGFSFGNFLLDAFSIFIFVLWFWLLDWVTSSAEATCRA